MDKAARGEGKRGPAAADETMVWLRGDVSSVFEASRTTMWGTSRTTAKRGGVGCRFRRSHRTATVVIASAEKSVWTAVGNVVAEKAAGRRGSGTGDHRRKREHRTTTGCVTSVSGDLLS